MRYEYHFITGIMYGIWHIASGQQVLAGLTLSQARRIVAILNEPD